VIRLEDEQTVWMLRASTPAPYLARNDADGRLGVDPYDDGPVREMRDPRDVLVECGCGVLFWTHKARYCCNACYQRAYCRQAPRRQRAVA
jgi:hypothetical protein